MKHLILPFLLFVLALTSCETVDTQSAARAAMNEQIRLEPPGDYFIGRRMYKKDYKVWGWIREPGKPWKSARLVMLNEQKVLAPDRARNQIGSDNNYEYILRGRFTGATVYEPASNGFYPEFVVENFEVKNTQPANIYTTSRQADPSIRILQPPL